MSDPFLAEVKQFGFNFAPRGFATCDGQILPINQNQSLFSLLGTTYGGDGRTSFALPDLRGRASCHPGTLPAGGSSNKLGRPFGDEDAPLNLNQLTRHRHGLLGSGDDSSSKSPGGLKPGVAERGYAYSQGSASRPLSANSILSSPVQGEFEHENVQPFLVINFCIALQGVFPSRN